MMMQIYKARQGRSRHKATPVHRFNADWNHPTHIRFGVGRLKEIAAICRQLAVERPLLVTDEGIRPLPFVEDLVACNREAGITTDVFELPQGEPGTSVVQQGMEILCEHRYDGIIAVGGGSVLDASKAIALASVVGMEHLWEYSAQVEITRSVGAEVRLPRIVALPTTAGTGSEVGTHAVITDEERQVKRSIHHPDMLPAAVIADPLVTQGLGREITATTGMDALSHNLEAFCSPGFYPMHDAIAIQGLFHIKDWLLMAHEEPRMLEARVYVMAASIMGAIAFEKGLGAMHAIAHAVGARYSTHHGKVIGVTIPYVLKLNRKRTDDKLTHLARCLGLSHHNFDAVLGWVLDLRQELGIPASLGELGVTDEELPVLVERTLQDGNAVTNPVPLTPDKLEKLLRAMIRGRL
jgi:hypothetical protein